MLVRPFFMGYIEELPKCELLKVRPEISSDSDGSGQKMKFVLSWDDGHQLNVIAETMLRHNLKATFFVPARNLEGRSVMTSADLRF